MASTQPLPKIDELALKAEESVPPSDVDQTPIRKPPRPGMIAKLVEPLRAEVRAEAAEVLKEESFYDFVSVVSES